jgi:hypothetical protein
MGYFASLARQSGVRPGPRAPLASLQRPAIEVEETRTVEPSAQPVAPGTARGSEPAIADKESPVQPREEAIRAPAPALEVPRHTERQNLIEVTATAAPVAAAVEAAPVSPETVLPESLRPDAPPAVRAKPPALADIRAWVAQPPQISPVDGRVRDRDLIETERVAITPLASVAPPAAVENHTLEIGSIHISFEDSVPAKPVAPAVPARAGASERHWNSPGRYYLR